VNESPEDRRATGDEIRSGAALVTVICLLMLAAGISGWMAFSVGSHLRRSRATESLEQAFYLAEGGAERAASLLASGASVPAATRGNLGAGRFIAVIMPESAGLGSVGSVGGSVRLNPNNAPDNAFLALLPDGRRLSHLDLKPSTADYQGPASAVMFQPMGAGNQTTLTFNNSPYTVQNSAVYTVRSTNMTIRLYNDSRTGAGAVGQWRLEIVSPNAAIANSITGQSITRETLFTIFATGHVRNAAKSVLIRGVQTVSWSKYALWYDQEALSLWIVGGERFEGPVYSRPQLRFHSQNVNTLGQARFLERVLHVPASYQVQNSSVNPIFDRGITLNAPSQSMISVNMTQLRNEASYVFTGTTYMVISSNRLFVTNERRNWNRQSLALPDDGMVYVVPATGGNETTRPADLYISAVTGLHGRLSVAADRDIYITNHVRYAVHPTNGVNVTHALGMIAGRNVVVATNAPNNLDIFAHIICRDGGFGVADYANTSRGPRGILTVYGGIANKIRNAVGTTSGSGYMKNYIYDPRFRTTPPPRYPAIPDEFMWLGWDG